MKTTLRHRDLEELLTPTEAPEPPAGLAERIKAEIPEPLRLAEAGEAGNVVRPSVWRFRPLLAAAASVAVAVVGGYLGLRLMDQAPGPGAQLLDRRAVAGRAAESGADAAGGEAESEGISSLLQEEPAPPAEAPAGEGFREEERLRRQRSLSMPREGTRAGRADARTGGEDAGTYAQAPQPGASRPAVSLPPLPPPLGPRSIPEPQARQELSRQAREVAAGKRVATAQEEGQAAAAAPSAPAGASGEAGRLAAARPRDEARDQEAKLRALGYISGEPTGALGGTPGGVVGGAEGGAAPPAAKPEGSAQWAAGESPARSGVDRLQLDPSSPPPSTGGSEEPNDQPYGDVFFREYGVNPFLDTEEDRLSTFGLDVDTGSYTVLRRYLSDGRLPPREALRVEELVNYFRYGDRVPGRGEGDFALYAEGAPTPFAPGERYRLLRFAVRGREVARADRKPAALTFVVDVSGSMKTGNRLGLVQQALSLLLSELTRDDRVGLVVYGSHGRVLLEPTSDLDAIRDAIDGLVAEGSTNAEEGLTLGYEVASRHFRPGAINRLVLCSDGVANVGRTGPESILGRIEREARRGIELTTVGFGMGNYNDVLMEQLADRGDGRYAYVDDLAEARRIFVEELTGTLETVAADAKVQVEFDPEVVTRWRLLGYENRDVADERFRDDSVDAGEIGAGHTATALYEVKLDADPRPGARLATLRLRWRSKASGEVVEEERELLVGDLAPSWERASRALRLASLVAELGEILKGSYWAREGSLDEVFHRAQAVALAFPGDAAVAEFASLAGQAANLARAEGPTSPPGDGR